jgi:malate/lactate dehydrogenase
MLIVSQNLKGYLPKDDGLEHALTGADIVVIPAGIPRKCREKLEKRS